MTKKLTSINKPVVTEYSDKDIKLLDNEMKNRTVVFKAKLMKAAEEIEMESWDILDAKWIVNFYYNIAITATKVNNKTGELIPDEIARMAAMDKIVKFMTDNGKGNIVINNNISNTNNIWGNIPEKWEHLVY